MNFYPRCVRVFVFALVHLFFIGIGAASALDYPTRPVRLIVPYPPGGTTDVMARV